MQKDLRILTRKDVLDKRYHTLTVGKLKKFFEKHNMPDDAVVVVQRVEDRYYQNNNWGVYLKEGYRTYSAKNWNEGIKDEFLDKEKYPNIVPENLKPFTEEQIRDTLEQYTPAHAPVFYANDPNILFIDLHY